VTHCDYFSVSLDVSDIWEWVVKTCLGRYPYPQWNKFSAARDLLARDCFDKSVELEGHNSSSAMINRTGGAEGRRGEHDQLTLNHRELVQYAKMRSGNPVIPGSLRLPSPVDVPADKVLCGYFPEEGHVWIGSKFNWGETHKREYWLENVSHVLDWQYFVPNYMKPFRRRLRASIRERQWIVVEADRWTLEQQYWIHRQLAKLLPLGCLCWSGGKSLHASYDVRGVSEEEIFRFYRRAAELGVNDMSAYFPEQPVRFPGGWNKKTGKQQLVYVWDM
jgi:hypothetical protein